jgi:hypothetical protein
MTPITKEEQEKLFQLALEGKVTVRYKGTDILTLSI